VDAATATASRARARSPASGTRRGGGHSRRGRTARGDRRTRHDRHGRHVRREGAPHGGLQLGAHALERRAVRLLGFGDDLDGAQLESADRRTGPGAGVRAHDHDGSGRLRHDVADRAQTIELRHFQVHGDDVGVVLMDLAHRVEAVARRRHDPELGPMPAPQHVAQDPAHQRAVVDDEDARAGIR